MRTALTRRLLTPLVGLALLLLLPGYRGCAERPPAAPPSEAVSAAPQRLPAFVPPAAAEWVGDLALSAFAPTPSPLYTSPEAITVTIREGGPTGTAVLSTAPLPLNADRVGVTDISDLPYGFYDVEVVGLDALGAPVAYAAAGLTVREPSSTLTLTLEPVTFAGDVAVQVPQAAPGADLPAVAVDYRLLEVDGETGARLLVEAMAGVPIDPWEPMILPALQLGAYRLELVARDAVGRVAGRATVDFSHDRDFTLVTATLRLLAFAPAR